MANKTRPVHVFVGNIEKSLFNVNHHVATSFNFGKLVPVNFMEVMANGSYKINMSSLIRMSTPIKPIMSNIWLDVYPVFVPYRLLLKGTFGYGQKQGSWEELFTGHNEDTNWIDAQDIADIEGADGASLISSIQDASTDDSLCNYLFIAPLSNDDAPDSDNFALSPLIGRGYFLSWNELFRVEKVSVPYDISFENDGKVLTTDTYAGSAYITELLPVAKRPDLFTSVLPAPLPHGQSVALDLGSTAVVKTSSTDLLTSNANPLRLDTQNFTTGSANQSLLLAIDKPASPSSGSIPLGNSKVRGQISDNGNSGNLGGPTNLYADLTNTTAITLDALREAIALQHLLQNDSRGGLRYFEELYAHFGIAPEDKTLQRPQVLGHRKIYINVNQVLSNAGAEDGTTTKLGQAGAVSVTADRAQLFTFTATEPGIIYFFVASHHDQIYSQGNHPAYYRKNRLDFIWPEFAHVSAQGLPTRFIDAVHADFDDILGYQDYGDEFRFIPDRVSGLLNPAKSSSLSFWTLAQDFASKPLLNSTFIYENHEPIERALVTGSSGPDFIADFHFGGTQVLPLPAYGDPGLRVL